MDTDAPGTFDFIFYKGKGVRVLQCEKMGGTPDALDKTIYGSDHFSLFAEF